MPRLERGQVKAAVQFAVLGLPHSPDKETSVSTAVQIPLPGRLHSPAGEGASGCGRAVPGSGSTAQPGQRNFSFYSCADP